jgi:hypothetical protein
LIRRAKGTKISLYLPEGVIFTRRKRLTYAEEYEMKQKCVERRVRRTRLTKRRDENTSGERVKNEKQKND